MVKLKVHMKTILVCFTLLLLYSFVPSEVSPYPFTQSSTLWKIKGKGAKESYLFGTIHAIETQNFIFPEETQKLISKSKLVVMELAGTPNPMDMAAYIVLEEGTFFDFFSKEQTDTILQWAEVKMHVNEEQFKANFSKFKPIFLVQLVLQMELMGKTKSYEGDIEKLAKTNKIPIKGLETVEEQLAVFTTMTKEEQAEMVMETIRNEEKGKLDFQNLQQLYLRQQVDSMYMMISNSEGTVSNMQASLLDDRNKKWIPLITQHIQNQKTFIAVGAGHLGGPEGVIRLLQKEGYEVTPVLAKP
jgi:uncharacterized protein